MLTGALIKITVDMKELNLKTNAILKASLSLCKYSLMKITNLATLCIDGRTYSYDRLLRLLLLLLLNF